MDKELNKLPDEQLENVSGGIVGANGKSKTISSKTVSSKTIESKTKAYKLLRGQGAIRKNKRRYKKSGAAATPDKQAIILINTEN